MKQFALLITALLMLFTLASFPAAAQLVGTDTTPGSSCVGFPDGATRITADADLDGAEVVLVCDGTTWNAVAGGSGTPSGAVMAFDLATCPTGWSSFTGAAGRVVVGTGTDSTSTGGPYTYNLNDTGGDAKHTLSVAEMPSHSHTYSAVVSQSGGPLIGTGMYGYFAKNTSSAGGNGAHENRPSYLALLYCKKN